MKIGQELGLVLAASLCACGGGMGYGPGRIEDEVSGGRSPLEAPLAVSATYRPELKLELKDIGTPALFLDSGQPSVVAIEAESPKGVAPGLAPILIKTREGIVLDFFHVWVEQPTRLAVHRFTPTGADSGEVTARLDVTVGESVTLAPRIYSGSQRLAGSTTTEWDVERTSTSCCRSGVAAGTKRAS
jgi:hypothetical protein